MSKLRNCVNPLGSRGLEGSLLLVIFLPLSHYKKGIILNKKRELLQRNCNVYH